MWLLYLESIFLLHDDDEHYIATLKLLQKKCISHAMTGKNNVKYYSLQNCSKQMKEEQFSVLYLILVRLYIMLER